MSRDHFVDTVTVDITHSQYATEIGRVQPLVDTGSTVIHVSAWKNHLERRITVDITDVHILPQLYTLNRPQQLKVVIADDKST